MRPVGAELTWVVTGPGTQQAEGFVSAALERGVPVTLWPVPSPRAAGAPLGRARLTSREREILALVAGGISNKGIARALQLSPNTVKFHVAALLTKLDAATRAEAVAEGARRGELSL